ncbi:MAG: hypothetical protein ABJC19_01835 [Gemmatimonadota bacterium]
MTGLVIILRIIHLIAGVFWVGAVIFLNLLVGPSVMAAGPEGMKVMQELRRRHFMDHLLGAGAITILAGLGLVWIDSAGFQPEWFRSHLGMAISTGMLMATVAWLIGLFVIHPLGTEMASLAGEMATAPSDDARSAVGMRMMAARGRLIRFGATAMALMVLTVVTMAVARYI